LDLQECEVMFQLICLFSNCCTAFYRSLATYLNPSFVQFRDPGQFFSHINIRIVTLAEGCFQFLQLLLRERRPMSSPGRRRRHVGRHRRTADRRRTSAGCPAGDPATVRLAFDLLECAVCKKVKVQKIFWGKNFGTVATGAGKRSRPTGGLLFSFPNVAEAEDISNYE
jgi:hypothetical protein